MDGEHTHHHKTHILFSRGANRFCIICVVETFHQRLYDEFYRYLVNVFHILRVTIA